MKFFHLQHKLLLLVLPFVIIPILVFGLVSSQRIETVSRHSIESKVASNAEQIDKDLRHLLEVGQANLTLFSRNELVVQYLLASNNERYNLLHPALLNTFHAFHQAYPNYYEIRLILPDGYEDVRYADYSTNISEYELKSQIVQKLNNSQLKDAFLFSLNPDNLQPSLYMAQKIILSDFAKDNYRQPPKLKGYLVITIDLQDIQDKLDRMAKELGARFQLIGLNGGAFMQSRDKLSFNAAEQFQSIQNKFKESHKVLDLSGYDVLTTSFSIGSQIFDQSLFFLMTILCSLRPIHRRFIPMMAIICR